MNPQTFNKSKPAHRKIKLYLIDAAVVLFSYLFSHICYIASFDLKFNILTLSLEFLYVVLIHVLLSVLFKVNNMIWRYADSYEYLYIFLIYVLSGIITTVTAIFIFDNKLSIVCYLLSEFLTVSLIILSRIIYHECCVQKSKHSFNPNSKRLLIIGAGSAGSRLLEEIRMTPECKLLPVGFVDDSPQKIQRDIHGVKVLGSLSDVTQICNDEKIDIIYLAIPSLSPEKRSKVFNECLKTTCVIKTLPVISEITDKNNLINSIRNITPEELLGREPMEVADDKIMDFVSGKIVLITGGGGSIGSEICRQVASHNPERLIIVDVYENNAYDIQQELINKYGNSLNMEVYIATVCDYNKIESIFMAEKPDIVIHAAAHKHVPLMETVPDEAVKNNVFGTLNTVLAARKSKVQVMVLISTDKAVNPTNIMGATKRICEMIIQYADIISPDTRFTAVRFGNVLGSNGSVIPLFKKQITERHEVTVTHPDIIRYFMTISEASQLVLTAGAMANGGEIFVLDMGESVKIDDLAKNMIRLAGLTLGRDINIRYTGLRPGEKLYEELLMSEEGLNKTQNKKIFIGKTIPMDYEHFQRQLEELKEIVNAPTVSSDIVESKLMEIVPTFHRNQPSNAPAENATA